MTEIIFPVDKSHLLIEIPKNLPQIGFFGGIYTKEINESIQRDYRNFLALNIASYNSGLIKGSILFIQPQFKISFLPG